jgi:hypothetical protein
MRPPDELLPLLRVAAELRATGSSWVRVGERVNRDPETCRQWPRRYRNAWGRLYRAAESSLVAETAAIAQVRLRQQVLSDDPGVSERATRFAIQCRHRQLDHEAAARSTHPDRDQPLIELARVARSLTEEDLTACFQELVARRDSEAKEASDVPPPA